MKIKSILIIIITLIISWLVPSVIHKITDKPNYKGFTYYSSVEKSFCTINFDSDTKKSTRINLKTGKKYSRHEFDSILPLFYYRQLLSENKMPNSIHGKSININDLNKKTFFFRYSPREKNKPKIPLYTLFESESGRVNLETPKDMFRINKKIEFINPKNNVINEDKSQRFNQELIEKNFKFSPKIVSGNPSARKKYDEGYFIVDKENQLFHLKMVKNKPFVKKINLSDTIKIVYISTLEPKDRSFYAFMFDSKGYIYVITTQNYAIKKLPIAPINIDESNITIMSNPIYWNVDITNKHKETIYAIHSETNKLVDKYIFNFAPTTLTIFNYIFPFELKFKSNNTFYIQPKIKINKYAIILNIILSVLLIFIFSPKKHKYSYFTPIWILLTGIWGLFAELLFFKK